MRSNVISCVMVGAEPVPVSIEATSNRGRGSFHIVGLPDAAVREARQRVRSAIREQGLRFPSGGVVVNLSPADLPKVGSTYDLPIALAILATDTDVRVGRDRFVAVGELSLHGDVRPVRSVMGAVEVARRLGLRCLASTSSMVSAADAAHVAGVESLAEAVAVVAGTRDAQPVEGSTTPAGSVPDLATVRGQPHAKRALEIAAAGGHHLLVSGPPGSGKTLLARCLPGILPELTDTEEREVALIWSTAGCERGASVVPPFRAPHHSASLPSLVGGGVGIPTPGEVSMAHRGVLFLDELGEFPIQSLEALRQPIEDGVVTIARSARTIRFPARFQVVAATNPCPCGFDGDWREPCRCSEARKERYRARFSGPLLDRFDLRVRVDRVRADDLAGPMGEAASDVRGRVAEARAVQLQRGGLNRDLSVTELEGLSTTPAAAAMLLAAVDQGGVSGRGWDRLRRVARTISDLEGAMQVDVGHVGEALSLRSVA